MLKQLEYSLSIYMRGRNLERILQLLSRDVTQVYHNGYHYHVPLSVLPPAHHFYKDTHSHRYQYRCLLKSRAL